MEISWKDNIKKLVLNAWLQGQPVNEIWLQKQKLYPVNIMGNHKYVIQYRYSGGYQNEATLCWFLEYLEKHNPSWSVKLKDANIPLLGNGVQQDGALTVAPLGEDVPHDWPERHSYLYGNVIDSQIPTEDTFVVDGINEDINTEAYTETTSSYYQVTKDQIRAAWPFILPEYPGLLEPTLNNYDTDPSGWRIRSRLLTYIMPPVFSTAKAILHFDDILFQDDSGGLAFYQTKPAGFISGDKYKRVKTDVILSNVLIVKRIKSASQPDTSSEPTFDFLYGNDYEVPLSFDDSQDHDHSRFLSWHAAICTNLPSESTGWWYPDRALENFSISTYTRYSGFSNHMEIPIRIERLS